MTALIPARVAVALMILGGVFGFLVGLGASPWCLSVLPLVASGFIYANRVGGVPVGRDEQ